MLGVVQENGYTTIYEYIFYQNAQKQKIIAKTEEIWCKMGYLSQPDSTSRKNPTYISHESEREIAWDNIMNNYIKCKI